MRLDSLTSNKKESKKQLLLSIYDFFGEAINLGFAAYLAVFSSSIICWIDVVVSISATLRATIVVIVFLKTRRNNSDKYNYGMERFEAFISFICDSLIILAMLSLFGTSIYGLFNPTSPTDTLFTYLVLKSINIISDGGALIAQKRLCKKNNNKLKESELQNYTINTIHDVVVAITVAICYVFRDQPISSYLSPIISMLLICLFIYKCAKHMKESFNELADVSIPIHQQDEIFDILLENTDNLNKITAVNCHILNKVVYVDIVVSFKQEVTYEEQMQFLSIVKSSVQEKIPDAKVRLVLSDPQLESNC